MDRAQKPLSSAPIWARVHHWAGVFSWRWWLGLPVVARGWGAEQSRINVPCNTGPGGPKASKQGQKYTMVLFLPFVGKSGVQSLVMWVVWFWWSQDIRIKCWRPMWPSLEISELRRKGSFVFLFVWKAWTGLWAQHVYFPANSTPPPRVPLTKVLHPPKFCHSIFSSMCTTKS